ncbi:unnamed protein product, partial [Rotaria magnacalcarata]
VLAYEEEINRLHVFIEQHKEAATNETLNDEELKQYLDAVGHHHLLQLWVDKVKQERDRRRAPQRDDTSALTKPSTLVRVIIIDLIL